MWERLGLDLGGFGGGFGRDLEPLGVSWAVFYTPFFLLVFGVIFKSALGGVWVGYWVDLGDFGEGLGNKLRGFWLILGCSALLWLALAGVGLLWLALTCFGLTWLA